MTVGLLSVALSPSNLVTAKTLISGFDLNEGRSYAFMNFAKGFGGPSANGSFNFAKYMNADGYPTSSLSVAGGGWSYSLTLDSSLVGAGVTWVLEWTGTGGINIAPSDTAGINVSVGTSFTGGANPNPTANCNGVNGYIEFTFTSATTSASFSFSQFGVAYDGTMSNLKLYRKSDQTAFNAGAIFTSEFLSYMRTLNPKVIRTMDWTSTNFSNLSSYTYKCPTTAATYLTPRFFPNLYAGDTAATDTYTCSAPTDWSGLVDGATVQVRFTNANTSTTPTLNVGGTGAVTIVTLNNAAPSAGVIAANCQATLVYDLWLNVWVGNFSQPSNGQAGGGLTSTMPIELQVALCNQLNTHLWINIPFYYTNAAVSSLAAYIRDNLNPGLSCYFEYTNEHWNFGFTNFTMCQARGAYLGFPNNNGRQENGYYGLRVRQIMSLVTTAWSPRSTSTLRRVMATQAQTGGPSGVQTYQLNGADLDTTLGYTNYNSKIGASFNVGSPTFSRPVDMCDVFSYATYYAGPVLNNGGGYTGLNALDLSSLTAAADTNNLAYVDNQFRQGVSNAVTASLPSGIASNVITVGTNVFTGGNANIVVVSSSGTLPTGLAAGTIYYVVNRTTSTIQLSATSGGSPLAISGGTGTMTVGSLGGETLLWFNTFLYSAWEPIVASYDGARPGGFSNIKVECYEGALEAIAPTTAQCTSMGIATSYSASIATLLTNYKNDARASQLVQDQFTQFMASGHSVTPAWFSPQGPNQWALQPGSVLTTPFQTYQGNAAFNH